jgi:hypothetical protein
VSALPDAITDLCAMLGGLRGVEAVTIGGSRAPRTAYDPRDWDTGVCDREAAAIVSRRASGHVSRQERYRCRCR